MRRFGSFAVLFIFWLVITGSLKPFDLGVGFILCVAFGYWADHVLWRGEPEPLTARSWIRLPAYLLWLVKEIVVAALYVAERVLEPKPSIGPVIHTHRVHFESDAARVAFANSVTLTPGTITIDVSEDTYVIHCLHESFSDGISSGDLERRVARVFES